MEVRRGAWSDLYLAYPALETVSRVELWPTGALATADKSSRRLHRPPDAVISAPPIAESEAFARIETMLTGWPFRAFASEAWYSMKCAEDAAPVEFRYTTHLALLEGQELLVPMHPILGGILGDVFFWSSVAWASVAFPLALRKRKREKYGKCVGCGYAMDVHAVKRAMHCPACSVLLPRDPLAFARSPEMHFQNAYVWFIFISSLDIMLTWKILEMNGEEVNPVAAVIIDAWGMQGAVAFKFALVMWVIVMCELLARLRASAGKFLAYTAVSISALPVVWSLALLLLHAFFPSVFE